MSDISDRIKPTDCSITTYLDDLKARKYQIPTFQRDVVWEAESVKKLWDSLYRFYPIGSILIWRTELELQKHRAIGGYPLEDDIEHSEYQYILDGQQRTTSLLTSIYGGTIEGRNSFDPALYFDLTVEASAEPEDESFKERFLFWSEIDDQGRTPHRNNERKARYDNGLVIKLWDIVHRYTELVDELYEAGYKLTDPPQRRLSEMKRVLDNYRIALIRLKGIRVAEVCQIFERINQAGKPLSIFDIVVAKTFEPVRQGSTGDGAPDVHTRSDGFYLRDLIEGFRASIPDSAFRSVGDLTLLQAAAAVVREEVEGTKVKNVTDRYLNELTTDELRAVWPETARALKKTFDLFENHLKLKGPALISNRYLYLAFAVYFYRNDAPDYKLAKRFFWYHGFHHERLLRSTSMLWSQISLLKDRKKGGREAELDTFTVDREALRTASYSSRGRYSRAVLALFANQSPRDWRHPDTSVLKDVYYQLTDQPNLHHIFPLAFTAKMDGADWVDRNSLMNIAYLTQLTNLKISDKNPVDYVLDLPAFSGTDETRERVAASHLLPDELFAWAAEGTLPDDALRQFIEARVDLVLDQLKAKVGAERTNVIDTRFSPTA